MDVSVRVTAVSQHQEQYVKLWCFLHVCGLILQMSHSNEFKSSTVIHILAAESLSVREIELSRGT